MSLAEVVRRGIEEVVQHYPAGRQPSSKWRPPEPRDLGDSSVPEKDWTILSHD
jgi:hypothetical protein